MSEEIITRVKSNAFVLGDGDGVMGNRVILCTSHSMWCVCVSVLFLYGEGSSCLICLVDICCEH